MSERRMERLVNPGICSKSTTRNIFLHLTSALHVSFLIFSGWKIFINSTQKDEFLFFAPPPTPQHSLVWFWPQERVQGISASVLVLFNKIHPLARWPGARACPIMSSMCLPCQNWPQCLFQWSVIMLLLRKLNKKCSIPLLLVHAVPASSATDQTGIYRLTRSRVSVEL